MIRRSRSVPIATLSTASALLFALTAAAADGTSGRDGSDRRTVAPNLPPSVALTAPHDGDSFDAFANITLRASATDSDGRVRFVKFFANGLEIGRTDRRPPYAAVWRHVQPGHYVLTAVAVDDDRALATSAPIAIDIKPAPTALVTLTSPAEGAVFIPPASIPLAATTVIPSGVVTKVDFYAGATVVATSTVAPYQATWSNPAAGAYDLKAVATINGVFTVASAVTHIIVDALPTVSITAPAAGASFTTNDTVTITATAADADGTVTKVDFYAGVTLIGTDLDAPYSIVWTPGGAGDFALTAVATDNRTATTTSAAVNVAVAAPPPPPPANDPTAFPLVQPADLVLEGTFRLPAGIFGVSPFATFEFGGTALGFNDASRNSLFLVGHDQGQLVTEIALPEIRNSLVLSDLATAGLVQVFADPTQGRKDALSSHPIKFGGLLPYNGRLYSSVYDFFDVNNDVTLSHFDSNMNLSVTTDVQGAFQVQNTPCDPATTCLDAGFFGGYFGTVPSLWQPLLGGPVVNGQCCINIISRTSFGPAIFAIDPAQLGKINPLPATPLLYYPQGHPLLEDGQTGDGWSNTSILFNGATEVKGVVIPEGTRSVLFFGRQGVGRFCYGIGTDQAALNGTLNTDGVELCYDPSDLAHGTHAYPYKYYVWAYDANDLKAVKEGTKNPWDPRPYAVWGLTLPFATDNAHLNGATYDPNTGRIYVSQAVGDGTLPVIYSFKVQLP